MYLISSSHKHTTTTTTTTTTTKNNDKNNNNSKDMYLQLQAVRVLSVLRFSNMILCLRLQPSSP
jgi:hypothetical protein